MKILFLSSEVFPFSKTGGLADVAGALPAALARLGHEVVVATPHYASVKAPTATAVPKTLSLRFPFGTEQARFHVAEVSRTHRVLLVGNDRFFARDGIYGDKAGEFGDNHLRFGFFTMAALSGSQLLDFKPDVVHLNDWQTGLAPVALQRGYRGTALDGVRTVFTIHNLAYQGWFPKRAMNELGLPWDLFVPDGVEFYDQVNFLKAGLVYSDALTTVSPKYAKEILTAEAGYALEGLLRRRVNDLHGILNGVDTHEWDPRTDPHLPKTFDRDDLSGKQVCRDKLLQSFGLDAHQKAPVFGVVSRLANQKGFDILIPVLHRLLDEHDARVVVLGSGDPRYEAGFRELAARHPKKAGVRIGYDTPLSHLIEAGSDFFMMPSLYEPCGLNQMYSLLYGTVPIVRAVGGLEDTVRDLSQSDGTGIKFGPFEPEALWDATRRALELFARPARLADVRRRGMNEDFSWERSARAYVDLYRRVSEDRLPKAGKAK